jgi:hypothetical protein
MEAYHLSKRVIYMIRNPDLVKHIMYMYHSVIIDDIRNQLDNYNYNEYLKAYSYSNDFHIDSVNILKCELDNTEICEFCSMLRNDVKIYTNYELAYWSKRSSNTKYENISSCYYICFECIFEHR